MEQGPSNPNEDDDDSFSKVDSDEETSEEEVIKDENNKNVISVASVMRALDDFKIFGYMDGPMMGFFRNLVATGKIVKEQQTISITPSSQKKDGTTTISFNFLHEEDLKSTFINRSKWTTNKRKNL